jgi:hypothetical protein
MMLGMVMRSAAEKFCIAMLFCFALDSSSPIIFSARSSVSPFR